MNIARFTFSLALLSSVVTPIVAHKDGCSHDCKHESLHPTKTTKKSTSSHTEEETNKTKKADVARTIEIAESTIVDAPVAQKLAEPVTVTTVSAPVQVVAPVAVTPVEAAPAVETVKAPEIVQVAVADANNEAPNALEITVESTKEETITVAAATEEKHETATSNLSAQEAKERRLLLADATPEDLAAIDDIAALLEEEELTLSSAHDAQPVAEIKTAAAPAPEAQDAQEDINNLTQVMI